PESTVLPFFVDRLEVQLISDDFHQHERIAGVEPLRADASRADVALTQLGRAAGNDVVNATPSTMATANRLMSPPSHAALTIRAAARSGSGGTVPGKPSQHAW